ANVSTNAGTNAGSVTVTSPSIDLGANVSINTDAAGVDGNITFTGPVNADSAANNRTLTLQAGGGTASTQNVGATRNLNALAGTGTTTFSGRTVGTTLSVATDGVTLNTATLNVTGTTTITAQNAVNVNTNAGLAGTGTVAISANQDGAGTQGYTQASGTTVST